MMAIGIHGTRAVRRKPPGTRAGQTRRHNESREGGSASAITLMVLSVNLFGDWLRDRLDPRLRQL